MNIRRDLDARENPDSSENNTRTHCSEVHLTCSLHQVNRPRQRDAISRTHLSYRPYSRNFLYTVYLEIVVSVDADSRRNRSSGVLCLIILELAAKYRPSCEDVTRGRPAL
ncbi:hypothetical protein AVEN_72331-1 [Araneus ventricosus]|uniref:Uncharacterized protein n=1 Tax=Araneus ventricosus TaxID=182803 RepID=A0A4Y2JKH2_ARAVE|nr:hypothetical protein AVEN_72331-1 [Araneus ventricosus]